MSFYKRNGSDRRLYFYKTVFFTINNFYGFTYQTFFGLKHYLLTGAHHFSFYYYRLIEVQGGANNQAQANLSGYFKLTSQTIGIGFLILDTFCLRYPLGTEFQVVVNKTNHTTPHRYKQHEYDVDVFNFGKQQSGH